MMTNTNNYAPRNGQMGISSMFFTRNHQETKIDPSLTSNKKLNDLYAKNK